MLTNSQVRCMPQQNDISSQKGTLTVRKGLKDEVIRRLEELSFHLKDDKHTILHTDIHQCDNNSNLYEGSITFI